MKTIKFIPTKYNEDSFLTTSDKETSQKKQLLICTKDSLLIETFNTAWSFFYELPSWFKKILRNGSIAQYEKTKAENDRKNMQTYYERKETYLKFYEEQVIAYLGIITEPPLERVVQQLKLLASKVWKQLPTSQEAKKKFEIIYNHFYDFLLKKLRKNQISSSIKKQLQDIPMMYNPDEPQILIPAKVSFGADEIRPYLYKYPLNLGTYRDLFKAFGCTEEFTLAQYSLVLEQIWKESKGKPLNCKTNPNDFIAIQKALYCILLKLKKDNIEEIKSVSELFIFTKSNCLQNIRETYYVDLNFAKYMHKQQYIQKLDNLKERIIELINIDNSHVRFSEFDLDVLFNKLPENLKPMPLSSLLQEQITEESLKRISYDESMPGVQLALYFEKKFSSDDFIEPLSVLLSWMAKSGDAYKALQWQNEKELFAFVSEKLGSLNFVCCCGLTSILYLNGVVQENSENSCKYLVSETNKIYFNDTSDFSLLTDSACKLVTELSFKINALFSNYLERFQITVKQLIKAENKGEWKNILAETDIPNLDCTIFCPGFLPEPGMLVPIDLHFSACQNFYSFTSGEYVGFELEDPIEIGCKGEPKLMYAIVESEIMKDDGPSVNHLKIYSIKVSSDQIINVPAVSLYKFCKPISYVNPLEVPEMPHQSADDIVENVTKMLHDISYLPVELQNKIVKRLLVQWMSINKPGKEKLCQQITSLINKHCNRKISAVENNYFDSPLHSAWLTAQTFYGSSSKKNICGKVRPNELQEYLIERANNHRANQKCYENDFHHSQSLSTESPYYLPKRDQKVSRPLQARKLFSQVEYDLRILKKLPESDWSILACYLVSYIS